MPQSTITTYAAGVNYTKHKRTEITQTTHPPPQSTPTKVSITSGKHAV